MIANASRSGIALEQTIAQSLATAPFFSHLQRRQPDSAASPFPTSLLPAPAPVWFAKDRASFLILVVNEGNPSILNSNYDQQWSTGTNCVLLPGRS